MAGNSVWFRHRSYKRKRGRDGREFCEIVDVGSMAFRNHENVDLQDGSMTYEVKNLSLLMDKIQTHALGILQL